MPAADAKDEPAKVATEPAETAKDTTIKSEEPAAIGDQAAAPDAAMAEAAETPAQDSSKANPPNEANEKELFEEQGQQSRQASGNETIHQDQQQHDSKNEHQPVSQQSEASSDDEQGDVRETEESSEGKLGDECLSKSSQVPPFIATEVVVESLSGKKRKWDAELTSSNDVKETAHSDNACVQQATHSTGELKLKEVVEDDKMEEDKVEEVKVDEQEVEEQGQKGPCEVDDREELKLCDTDSRADSEIMADLVPHAMTETVQEHTPPD